MRHRAAGLSTFSLLSWLSQIVRARSRREAELRRKGRLCWALVNLGSQLSALFTAGLLPSLDALTHSPFL